MTKARELADLGDVVTVDASGNVGIGITSPAQKLVVDGNIMASTGDGGGFMLEGSSGIFRQGINSMGFNTNGAERMRLDASGNVGIGTASFDANWVPKLQVSSSAADGTGGVVIESYRPSLIFKDASGSAVRQHIVADDSSLLFGSGDASFTERMRIDSSGNVGIGTSSPSVSKLHLNYNSVNNRGIRLQDQNGTYDLVTSGAGNNNSFGIYNDTQGAYRLFIDASGNVGIGTSGPSYTAAGRGNLNIAGSGSAILGFQIGGTAKGYVFHDNTNLQLWNEVSGTLLFGTNGTERLRIDASGNVGIGTSAATGKLTLRNDSTSAPPFIDIVNRAQGSDFVQGGIRFASFRDVRDPSYAAAIWSYQEIASPGNSAALAFGTVLNGDGNLPQERMRIDSSGNLLVAKTTTSELVDGVVLNNGGIRATSYSGVDAGVFYRKTAATANGVILTKSDVGGTNTLVGAGFANGTFGTVSDANKKKNVESCRGYLDDLMQIRVVKYNWITDEDTAPKDLGWIAQEVEQVFPGLVTEIDGSKLLKKEVFVPMLLKALQEQQTIIEALEARITALEA